MSKYTAPLADMRFALFDVLGSEALLAALPGGDAAPRDLLDAVLEESAKFNEQVLAPLNQSGDAGGCTLDKATGRVSTPKGFRDLQTIELNRMGLARILAVTPELYNLQLERLEE